ncbi:MAG: type II secretion system F family protein [Acidobacteriota bacterium]|jgi:tight adherence protein C
MALLTITFIATFLLVLSLGLLLFHRNTVMERFSTVVGNRLGSSQGVLERIVGRRTASVETLIKPFENIVPRSAAEATVIQKRLIRAGYRKPSAVSLFYGTKVVIPIGLLVLAIATGAYQWSPFIVLVGAAGLGFLLPDYWLSNRISNRQYKIRTGLPEALDLMVICTEAGLGLDQTIYRVSEELKLSHPKISEELSLVILEQKAGLPRADALKNFAERTGLNTVRALANTLIQADLYGTSIAKTLRVYAETMRTQRHQQAEEQAAKTTVKLVFPLVLFIFPSVFVVTLGPALISMAENFAKVNQ